MQLEQLWNELARHHAFTLFCAYPLQDRTDAHHIEPFEAVCASHTRVIPVESATALSVPEQGRLIAQLQQRALVLERKLEQEVETQRALSHMAAIVASSDDAIISKSLDGVIQTWNAGAQRIFGWTAEEAIGRPVTLIIPPERLAEEQRIIETLRRGERIEHFETTRVAKDGRLVEVSLTISPIRNAAGAVIGASKIARDITERRGGEELLRERERALEQANADLQSRTAEMARFNQAAVGREMRVIELKGEVNALLAELGRGGRYSLDFERNRPVRENERCGSTGEASVPLEEILRTERLHERPPRPPDHEAEGRALAALMEALADSPRTILQVLSDKVLELLNAGSAGLSLLAKDGKRFYWAAIAGAWSPHLGGGTPREFGPCGDVLDRDAPLLFTHWERRYPYLAEATPLAEEGLLVPFRVGGELVGTIWAISHEPHREFDREDLRLLERLGRFASIAYQAVEFVGAIDQHRAALNLLEDAVQAQRRAETSNRKLRESEEALRETDRRKNEFLALLGHELRNPLAPIRNASELLSRMLSQDARARVAIDMIRRQTAQLTRLVDDLLDMGRITQGHIKLQCECLDLSGVIAQAVETVEPQLREKQHELLITSHYESLHVSGDFVRLVQCIVNLLTNAAKYTDPRGKITMAIRPEGSNVVIEVTDNGVGIAPELLPKVFDLFVQSDRTLDRAQGGLGIGLSIVKRLIEMHGGEVCARSAGLGHGSTFEIRLPRLARARAASRAEAPFKAEPRRVLIVDDNADAANSLALLLSFNGHETHAALSGREAIALIESFRPDVALLDIGLPEMDGYELARRLRANPALDGVWLVALTGYGQAEDRQRSRSAGFDDHLVKPVDPAVLERALAGIPSGRSGERG